MLRVGRKTISVHEAMAYYNDSFRCQHVLSLTHGEYVEMLVQLVTFLSSKENRATWFPQVTHETQPRTEQHTMPNYAQMDQKIFNRIFDFNGGVMPDLTRDPRAIGNTQTRITRQTMYP